MNTDLSVRKLIALKEWNRNNGNVDLAVMEDTASGGLLYGVELVIGSTAPMFICRWFIVSKSVISSTAFVMSFMKFWHVLFCSFFFS